ncbi:MAG: alpha/beta fold hydrolase [Nannocystaceae bacterium]|nr:alpha/beta fold hydrolase [Nannocystaceae bacterium]
MQLAARTPQELVRTAATDGYSLTYRAWRPTSEPRATIVLFNGIMSHSGWFFPLVDPLVNAGYAVIGADRRGSGLNEEARGDAPSGKAIVDDALAIIEHSVPDGHPIILAGWCWGSILALNLVRPLGDRVGALVLLTPGLFPTTRVVQAARETLAAAAGAADDEPAVETPIAETMFTKGPYLDAFVRPDPHKLLRLTPRFFAHTKKLGMGATMALRKLSLPTLLLLAEDDEATDNALADAGMAKASRAAITRRTAPGAHGMQFDAPEVVTDTMLSFMDRVLEG